MRISTRHAQTHTRSYGVIKQHSLKRERRCAWGEQIIGEYWGGVREKGEGVGRNAKFVSLARKFVPFAYYMLDYIVIEKS